MLTVTEHHYSPDKADRWRANPGGYLDHLAVGEPPHRRQTRTLAGAGWLPDGLPDNASYLSVTGPDGAHAFTPLADGGVIFGTGVACFAWQQVAVLDHLGAPVWSATVDLGVKGDHEVWTVEVAADPPMPVHPVRPVEAPAKPKRASRKKAT